MNAMHEELNNFTRNQVWEFVERPKGHNVIGTKGVFGTAPQTLLHKLHHGAAPQKPRVYGAPL